MSDEPEIELGVLDLDDPPIDGLGDPPDQDDDQADQGAGGDR